MKFEHMANDLGNPLGGAGLFNLINLEFNSISNFHESQQKQHVGFKYESQHLLTTEMHLPLLT